MFEFLKNYRQKVEIDRLVRFDESADETFSEQELRIIRQALSDARNCRTISIEKVDFEVIVSKFVGSPEETSLYKLISRERASKRTSQDVLYSTRPRDSLGDIEPSYQRIEPKEMRKDPPKEDFSSPWSMRFSATFSKRLRTVDGKLRGRILQAFTEILQKPVEPNGNTLKPLTNDMAGLWRYRIGDYRLIYQPEHRPRIITMLDFGPRGGIYT
jgi:mRNA-degrading endonuclease RelE of RelBE toxin-antitoxin system